MRSILLAHAQRYPNMEPTDAVKLIYQSEFGGGHLIRDESSCLDRLYQEYKNTIQQSSLPLWEDIGGSMVRVNLGALDTAGWSHEKLGQAFLRSAKTVRGSMCSFRGKLELLRELTRKGQMPFSLTSLEDYLKDYEAAGFPPVSHSDAYRNAYSPAYRVIAKKDL